MFDGFFDAVFKPLMSILPDPLNLIFIAFILTLIITFLYKFLTDQNTMKSLKEEMKNMQKEIKTLKDQPGKMMEMQKKAMSKNMEYMMKSMKPMLFTFIPIIIIFGWLRKYFEIQTAAGNPFSFFGIGWLVSYIIFSLIFSITLRKMLKVH